MKILVIGAGAIGCMLAARLARAQNEVVLVSRPGMAALLAEHGLRLEETDGGVLAEKVEVRSGIAAALDEGESYDLAIVAVKAYDTRAVAEELGHARGQLMPVLTVQNGVGNEETLAEFLASTPILAGTLTTPVEVLEPGHVRIARPSYRFGIAPGPGADTTDVVATLFERIGFQVQTFGDYRALKWTKLLMNMLANAQSAILALTPAEIFDQPDLGNLEIMAWREALEVMGRLGIRPQSLGGYPLNAVAPLVRRLPIAVVRPVLGRFIAGGRGSKMPSLYYDLYPEVRSRSEIGWLNGAIVSAARDPGLSVPVNETLTQVLSDIIARRSRREDWAGQPERLLAAVAARG